MGYIRCPFCGHSDGNDDKIIKQEVIYANNSDCQISMKKSVIYVVRNMKLLQSISFLMKN